MHPEQASLQGHTFNILEKKIFKKLTQDEYLQKTDEPFIFGNILSELG
jgi:hypothetical protein